MRLYMHLRTLDFVCHKITAVGRPLTQPKAARDRIHETKLHMMRHNNSGRATATATAILHTTPLKHI